MKHLKSIKLSDIPIGILFTLLFISLGTIITINFRPLYYLDVKALNIEDSSGMEKTDIINNYNTLIDYSFPLYQDKLSFPTLTASEQGLEHFAEVKDIFNAFYILAIITLPASILIILYKHRKKNYSYLLVSSITAIVLPLIIGFLLLINFDTTFRVFHEIFFKNDYWLFDPVTDPVITILPDQFFLHCALLIIFLVLVGSFTLLMIYLRKRKKTGIHYRKNIGLML